MLRNPAYTGRAVFGKTQIVHEQPGLNRVARLQGRTTPRAVKAAARPREEWTEIAVPAIVSEDTFARVGQRLADNKRFASRNSKIPSLLQGLAACSACGYAYYRGHTTTTAGNKIYYYRCWAATTTATKAAGYAATSRSAPTTSTPWSGTTSPACSPTRP